MMQKPKIDRNVVRHAFWQDVFDGMASPFDVYEPEPEAEVEAYRVESLDRRLAALRERMFTRSQRIRNRVRTRIEAQHPQIILRND